MRKILISLLIILLIVTGCKNGNYETSQENDNNIIEQKETKESDFMSYINVIINNKKYILNLEENETTKEFIKMIPQEFMMNDLNENEKYVYLDLTLPTNSYNPKQINKGDVYLYGNNCLVIFYKSFKTSYSYTKIGHIDNLDELESDNILVIFGK